MGIDPVGFKEDNLHSFNRYAYGNNNPVKYIDPDGNEPRDWFPKGPNGEPAPIVVMGEALGALAAYAVGSVTGNESIKNAAIEGMRETQKANVETLIILGTFSKNTRTVKVEPIKNAEGPHTTWKIDPATGKITRHETWSPNSKNPNGWDSVQSTDLRGAPHVNKKTGEVIETPHTQSKNIPGGVRPALPNEMPKQ